MTQVKTNKQRLSQTTESPPPWSEREFVAHRRGLPLALTTSLGITLFPLKPRSLRLRVFEQLMTAKEATQ